MRVAIIGTVGIPANYGGYETLAENLVSRKYSPQITYQVYCSSKAYSTKLRKYKGANLIYLPFNANGWQALIYDSISLFHAYMTSDVILSLGTGPCLFLWLLRLFSRKITIVNFDGLDHKRKKWALVAKRVIGLAREIAARYAVICVSDNDAMQEYVKETYKRNSILIEYGGDNAQPVYNEELLLQYGLQKGEFAFKVARIEPENNIEMILDAFSEMPSQKLVIVGNWERSTYGNCLREKYISFENIIMLDPIYDSVELNVLRSNCRLYIHGHSAGGTNPSLVEAMNLHIPILAFGVCYNKATTENMALYFYDRESLIDLLKKVSKTRLDTVADDMYKIAKRRYQWNIICRKYETLFLKDLIM